MVNLLKEANQTLYILPFRGCHWPMLVFYTSSRRGSGGALERAIMEHVSRPGEERDAEARGGWQTERTELPNTGRGLLQLDGRDRERRREVNRRRVCRQASLSRRGAAEALPVSPWCPQRRAVFG